MLFIFNIPQELDKEAVKERTVKINHMKQLLYFLQVC